MIKDEKLDNQFRELYYLCNNYLDNSYEQRLIHNILDQIKKIENCIFNYHADDKLLRDFLINIPEFDNKEFELISRNKIENLISFILFLITIPFALCAPNTGETNYLEIWREKTKYSMRNREKVRNDILGKILRITDLTIEVINKRK